MSAITLNEISRATTPAAAPSHSAIAEHATEDVGVRAGASASGPSASGWPARLKHAYDKLAFGTSIRAQFYTAVAEFGDAGLPPFLVLKEMIGVAERRFTQKSRAKVYRAIAASFTEGEGGLAAALASWVPGQEAATLAGAAEAGPAVLQRIIGELGKLLERQMTARKRLLKAVLGGGVGLLVAAGVVFEIAHTLVPLFDGGLMPASVAATIPFTVMYLGACRWLTHNAVMLVGVLILWGGLTSVLIPTWATRPRRFFDQYIPPYSLYQKLQATLFLSTAAAMMRAGIKLEIVLSTMRGYSSRWLRWHIDAMSQVLSDGGGEVKALGLGPLPNSTADALAIYKGLEHFQDVMTRLAEANFQAYERSITRLSIALSTLVTAIMTVFGGATVIAMFQFSDAMRAGAMAAQHAVGG